MKFGLWAQTDQIFVNFTEDGKFSRYKENAVGRNNQGVAVVKNHTSNGSYEEHSEDLIVWDDYMVENRQGFASIASSDDDNVVLGFHTYVQELPKLLKEKHEGHLVAYDGTRRLAIAPSDRRLHQLLVKQPDYEERKKELFVTRITELDAEEMGISL